VHRRKPPSASICPCWCRPVRSASRISDTGAQHISKHLVTLAIQFIEWVWALGGHIVEALLSGWEALRYRDGRIPIEVLVANGTRRRRLERKLRAGLLQLQRALGERPSGEVAVLVQQVITTDRQLAGCSCAASLDARSLS
jgi:hypothetical protein